jgi:carbamate kinase
VTYRRVVIALGGNAFVAAGEPLTMGGQVRFAHEAMRALLPVFESGAEVVLTHGNGPQVGHMLVRVEQSLGAAYEIPLEVCVAESEGELGYVLAQSLHNVLAERALARLVVSVLTQVEVDPGDPAFGRPTKPIGPFYEEARAKELRARGYAVVEDAGRGFRRVVPSPVPLAIVEADVVAKLLALGVVVVAAGGGGVPVVRRGERLEGVDAVIDKDRASALLAKRVGADLLLVLTGVPCAYIGFGTSARAPVGRVTPAEVRALASEGHFPEGSMGPKMEAAADFVDATGGVAIVTDPRSVGEALAGRAGTRVEREGEGT